MAACAPTELEQGGSTDASGKLSSNGLVLREPALRRLSTAPLPAVAAALAVDSDGRALLGYVTRCALDADDSIVVDTPQGPQRFHGDIGLAPAWQKTSCDGACRRWVSACLLAHANVPGPSVPIWLRGEHPALGTAPADMPYDVQEAAFYGDVFVDAAEPLAMYACIGRDLLGDVNDEGIEIIEESLEEYLHHRMCTTIDSCGITVPGFCQGDVPPEAVACDQDAGSTGAYGACHALPAVERDDPAQRDLVFEEVITVYVRD